MGYVNNVAYLIYYVYLCSRLSASCAGPMANNTLKKSDLTFSQEEVSVSFQVFLRAEERWKKHLERNRIYSNNIFII